MLQCTSLTILPEKGSAWLSPTSSQCKVLKNLNYYYYYLIYTTIYNLQSHFIYVPSYLILISTVFRSVKGGGACDMW